MAIEVFNRYENKYLVDDQTFDRLQRHLSGMMELDAYNQSHEFYTIANLYYDTGDDALIRTSLQKPKYKEKLRLRAYGIPGQGSTVYVEIKKKVAGLVNKRRCGMSLEEAYRFLETGTPPAPGKGHNRQVMAEIQYLLGRYELAPKVYLAYDRRAFLSGESACTISGQQDLRISFDTNIRTRRTNLKLEQGDGGKALLEQGLWLMEIKVARSMPVWLTKLLAEHQLNPVSFSKYGAEFTRSVVRKGYASPLACPAAASGVLLSSSAI